MKTVRIEMFEGSAGVDFYLDKLPAGIKLEIIDKTGKKPDKTVYEKAGEYIAPFKYPNMGDDDE
jgi:hypothetical protein